jgi:hypothetical protein
MDTRLLAADVCRICLRAGKVVLRTRARTLIIYTPAMWAFRAGKLPSDHAVLNGWNLRRQGWWESEPHCREIVFDNPAWHFDYSIAVTWASFFLARASRLMTVPIGTSNLSAASW